MRDFKNMKRQRGRNRGGGGGGGGKPQHNANRAFDSNGPDNVKIRGHAQHVFEKYQQLARDAFSSGDRVLAENYLQHADHYFRVLRTIQPQRPPSEILGRDVLASGLDIDFEEEFEAQPEETVAEAGVGDEAAQADGYRPPRDDRYERGDGRREPREGYERQDGRREAEGRDRNEGGYRERGDRPERDRPERDRADRERSDRDRPDRDRSERDRFEGRRERRFEGRREDRPFNREGREPRYDERRPAEAASSDPMPVIAPEPTASFTPTAPDASEGSPVLRAQDGALSEAPAFLQAPLGDEGEARRPRPRRRRAPRSFESGEGGDAPAAPVAETEEV
jgi:hypothetical protein